MGKSQTGAKRKKETNQNYRENLAKNISRENQRFRCEFIIVRYNLRGQDFFNASKL